MSANFCLLFQSLAPLCFQLFKLDGWHIFNSKFLLQPHRQQCRWWCFHQSIRFPTSPLPVFYLTMTYYFLWVYADYVQIDFILFTSRRISVEINLSVILPYFKYVKTHRIMPMGIADACPAVPFLPHSTSEFQCQPNRCVIMSHSWLRSCISMTMLELEPLPTVFFFFFFLMNFYALFGIQHWQSLFWETILHLPLSSSSTLLHVSCHLHFLFTKVSTLWMNDGPPSLLLYLHFCNMYLCMHSYPSSAVYNHCAK